MSRLERRTFVVMLIYALQSFPILLCVQWLLCILAFARVASMVRGAAGRHVRSPAP